jgi:DNA-binding NarL/FixJ family response regulator
LSAVRVVIVDDSPAWRRTVSSALQQHPDLDLIVVGESSDGIEALQKCDELQPDLILVDIGLPKLNGLDAARIIRKVAPGAKLLFLSSYRDPHLLHEALRIGGLGFVVKTDAASELLPAVSAVMRGEQFISSVLSDFDPTKPPLS